MALAAVLISLVNPVSASATDFKVYSTTNKDYAAKVDFVVACVVAKVLPDDPIVFPGQPGKSHSHTFSGNVSTNADSTPDTLDENPTNCKLSRDRAAYWTPSLYNDGRIVEPYTTRVYYRAGTYKGATVQPIPFGLRMVAGNAMAMTPQSSSIAGFQCRDQGGNTVKKQALPPRCPTGDLLEASIVFPNCWDGIHLDSVDHRSHLAYAEPTAACPSSYPVRIPQVTVAQRYPINSTRGNVTIATMMAPSMDSRLTLHADVMNAWDPATMKLLVDSCIHKNVACEDVSDQRLPPGSKLPAARFPTTGTK